MNHGCLQTIGCPPELQSITVTKTFSNGVDPVCLQTIGCLPGLQSAHSYISIQYWNGPWLSTNHRLSAKAAVCTRLHKHSVWNGPWLSTNHRLPARACVCTQLYKHSVLERILAVCKTLVVCQAAVCKQLHKHSVLEHRTAVSHCTAVSHRTTVSHRTAVFFFMCCYGNGRWAERTKRHRREVWRSSWPWTEISFSKTIVK